MRQSMRRVKKWLETSRDLALEKVNGTHDVHAPRFTVHRSKLAFLKTGDLVLEWRPISGKRLTSKLLRKWTGPIQVLTQTSPVNYKIQPLQGKRKPYIVHVERLKLFNERSELELYESISEPAHKPGDLDPVISTLPEVREQS